MTDRRWSLPSNRGMESLECEVVGSTDREMVCRFTLVGEYWNREPEAKREATEDFRVVLPQVIVARDALGGLRQSLVDWLEDNGSFSCALQPTDGGGQVLEVSLGDHPRLVRSTQKEVFTFSYFSGLVMTTSFSFMVDQSCVRMAIDGLTDCLRNEVKHLRP
ncbi:hypothetical protein [Stenotrophomonas sp.]|uniref:hypothetical protein n=1 Tax=Stenotrophomonas sp. TaxID=69392 RepID=UPI0028A053D8|nr:hypothetical protein [Stenotrophomonas sp.]